MQTDSGLTLHLIDQITSYTGITCYLHDNSPFQS
jgi:hypothetical protein